MTLAEINAASPELRTRIAGAFKDTNAVLLLDAIKGDILDGITRKPVIEAGETSAESTSRWHSFLAGMKNVVEIIENIDKINPTKSVTEERRPYEHSIPPHLVRARENNFKPEFPVAPANP